MNRTDTTDSVVRILRQHVGKDNAINSRQLYCEATGDFIVPAKAQSQTRLLRSIIKSLRYDSESLLPVCSGDAGYWLAETPEEYIEYLESVKRAAFNQFKLRAKGIRAVAAKIAKQKSFNFNS